MMAQSEDPVTQQESETQAALSPRRSHGEKDASDCNIISC